MKEFLKITFVLTLTCVVCAYALSFTFSAAKEKIALNAKKTIEEAIFLIVPSAKHIEEIKLENKNIYKLFDDKDNFINYAFLAQGDGYQGKIKILAVIDTQVKNLEGIEIIDSVETPGLGAKIQETPFKGRFKKLNVSGAIECVKGDITHDNQIKAITSATVSSRSVVSILNRRIDQLKKELGKPR